MVTTRYDKAAKPVGPVRVAQSICSRGRGCRRVLFIEKDGNHFPDECASLSDQDVTPEFKLRRVLQKPGVTQTPGFFVGFSVVLSDSLAKLLQHEV